MGSGEEKSFLKSVLMMSLGFFGVFMSFNATQMLQGTVNPDYGLYYNATIYIAFTISTLVAAPIAVKLGPRLSIVVGVAPYVATIAANMAPTPYVLFPFNALLGIGASLCWTGQGVYLTRCAMQYAKASNRSPKSALGSFNGLFFMTFQCNAVAGTLIAGFVSNSIDTVYLFLIYTCCSGLGLLTCCFLKRVDSVKISDDDEDDLAANPKNPLFDTFNLFLHDRRMQLLIGLIAYSGLGLGFAVGPFMKYIVGWEGSTTEPENVDTSMQGFVSATLYGVDMFASMLFGSLSDKVGKRFCVLVGSASHFAFISIVLYWYYNQPGTLASSRPLQFVVAGLYGIGDAAWNTQICSVIGHFFSNKSEAGFSNFKLWQSLGMAAIFFIGDKVSLGVQLWLLVGFLAVGTICFFLLNPLGYPVDEQRSKSEKPLLEDFS